jgi:hypothetical protein
MNTSVNIWKIINKLSRDKSLWEYLEPAEIMEIVQRITEAKNKIKGLEKHVHIDLTPALRKLESVMGHLHLNSNVLNYQQINNFSSIKVQKVGLECE